MNVQNVAINSKPILKIDWATHEAAKYACENWHYSKCIPVNKLVKIGVWEDEKYIGCVIYGYGTSPTISKQFNLDFFDVCELLRVALNKHKTEVSRIIAVSLKFLKKHCPKLKLVVSFSDKNQGHYGGIYQAGNWIYTGETNSNIVYKYGDDVINQMTIRHWKNKNDKRLKMLVKSKQLPKYRYIYPLVDRSNYLVLQKPYPKRAGSIESSADSYQESGGGVSPTTALQLNDLSGT